MDCVRFNLKHLNKDKEHFVEGSDNPTALEPKELLVEVVGDYGQKFTFDYYQDGKLKSVTDELGRSSTYKYTEGYLTEVTRPDGQSFKYTYDVHGKFRTVENPRELAKVANECENANKLQRSYIVIDVIQDITQLYKDEMKIDELDILSDAIDWGIVPIVAADTRFGIRTGKLVDKLQVLKNGIILGDATAQMIFEVGRMREHNKDVHFGYQMQPTGIRKIMLADEI
ncbi:RHS repeat domain-containing protein [Lachnobacterium bovis]|uniref:YD repeat-containing protein n=1 Tax=Lachnobacterium bovis TaxID=140626 RepID=A0A1H9UZX5_9FIRM|nr:RHS repeat domain-containing protein [Lachnobacterium bovis]SES14966.1 YD repeat-containing protein [Lachnobacterium bovis]